MQPRTSEVLSELDSYHNALQSAVAEVPLALRSKQPGPDRWSVAEVIEHLALVEGQIAELLNTQIDAARATGLGKEEETTPVVPTIDVPLVLDRSHRIAASDADMPRSGAGSDATWSMLAQQHEALRKVLLAADGLALSSVVAPHRLFGPLNVYQWAVFAAAHEGRHTGQIREIGGKL